LRGRERLGCLLVLLGLVSPVLSHASAGSDSRLQSLVSGYSLIDYGSSTSQGEIKVLGDAAQKFISDPANQKALSTPAGKELLLRQTQLRNYQTIAKTFEKCASNNNTRNLTARILDAAGKSRLITVDCQSDVRSFKTLDDAVTAIQEKVDYPIKAEFKGELIDQGLKNAASTFMALEYRHSSGDVNPDEILENCKKQTGISRCTENTQVVLRNQAQQALSELKASGSRRYSDSDAADNINARVDVLNADLKTISIGSKKNWYSSWIWNSTDPTYDDQAKKGFDQYANQYLNLASDGPGMLMITDHMRDKIGGLRQQEKDAKTGKDGQYSFTPHQKIAGKDISVAKNEAESKIFDQIQSLNGLDVERIRKLSLGLRDQPVDQDRDIANLIKTNPAATGQLLLQHPEDAGLVCNAVYNITQSDTSQKKTDANWNRVWFWGGMAVGGALLVTGVGTWAGALVLSATAAATTTTVLLAAGAVVGAGATANSLVDMGRYRQEQNEFQAAFFAGGSDQHSIQEAETALSSYKEARMQAAMNLGLTALDLGTLGTTLKAGVLGANIAANVHAINETTDVMKQINNDTGLVKKLAELKNLVGSNKIAKFIGSLPQASEKTWMTFLEKLKLADTKKAAQAIDDVIKAGEKSCG